MKRVIKGFLLLGTLVAISACQTNTPVVTPDPATAGETKSTMLAVGSGANDLAQELQMELSGLMSDLGLSGPGAQPLSLWGDLTKAMIPDMGLLSTGKFQAVNPRAMGDVVRQATVFTLPRGEYTCAANTCTKTAESNDYVVVRDTQQGQLKLVADWDGSSTGAPSPTVQAHIVRYDGTPDTEYMSEQPTKLVATVTLGSKTLAQATSTLAWRPSTCLSGKYLNDVPTAASIKGFVARLNSSRAIEVDASYAIGATSITSKGSLAVNGVNNNASATWDVSSAGTLKTGACGRLQDFTLSSVNFSGEVKANSNTLGLSFAADQFPSKSSDPGVRFQNGVLKVNTKQVLFSGVLNDSNANCVPGENMSLTFASGTTSLESYLINQFNMKVCN